jgi:sugar phosphate isomerase/epimerase
MFEKLGIVTNIWAKEIENGARFDDLMVEFGANGFRDMEVREGDYLRNSEFGNLIQKLEAAMLDYTDAEFKTICDAVWDRTAINESLDPDRTKHSALFNEIAEFARKAAGLTLSYAMSHSWLSKPVDSEADTQKIVIAKKLAYLLCPSRARLRLVDLETEDEIDENEAIANLKRYASLLPEYPMIFAVENARQSATLTLKLAVAGGAKLTYDETNTYLADGTTLNPPEEFWSNVKMDDLTSVHFKQKTETGVLSEVGDGYVDFRAIKQRLQSGDYTGDLLLENAPTTHSLTDALNSTEYLIGC